ncbi:MAG: hydrogenase 3 maturation endopeptidase HyCI [Clostridiales bacterium]|nr:hydrogenase 3 maturation endopeptidase HyCI [Clostridiales bacterium]
MRLNWREELFGALKAAGKVAVLGIGSPLNSDDAAGMLLIEKLEGHGLKQAEVLLIAASSAPENFTGVIGDFAPELLLAVDAARLGLEPGKVALLEKEELCGAGFSTHMLPFSIMLQYLYSRGLANVLLLGIEPQNTEFGLEISLPVQRAVAEIADFLALTLR